MTLYQHITEPSAIRLRSGDHLKNQTIVATGSRTGRFLFTSWDPLILIEKDAHDVLIQDCCVIGREQD